LLARVNYPHHQLYAASKAALDSLTRSWAKELPLKYRRTVNGIIVGPTVTPDAPDSPARDGAKAMMTTEKRLGFMDDVAEVPSFLAVDASRWINGDNIGCNGDIYIQSWVIRTTYLHYSIELQDVPRRNLHKCWQYPPGHADPF
jgi:3-oxoacyl-[acyl-carrier protein] reductase